MALSDKLTELTTVNTKCAYIMLLENMKEEDRIALDEAWKKGISQRIILRALRSEGYKTSNEAMLNHRSGNCKCPKS
jgi:cell division inhibitor SulA